MSGKSGKKDGPLAEYLRSLGNVPLLESDEINRLIGVARATPEPDADHVTVKRMAREAKEARDMLIRSNLRLVVYLARGYTRIGMDLEDLIAEGSIGLISAVGAFDPTRGVRFGTYATWWIKAAIKSALGNAARAIRIPDYLHWQVLKCQEAKLQLRDSLGREPTHREIRDHLGMNATEARYLFDAVQATEAMRASDDDEHADITTLASNGPSPPEESSRSEDTERVDKLLAKIPKRHADVLRMRANGKSLEEIGITIKRTRERVRQIEAEAIEMARVAAERLKNQKPKTRRIAS